LAAHAQPGQFVAQLNKLVSELQLPQTLPPKQIGLARRIDATADICALAKRFKNCLANFLTQIDAGGCAAYLWDDRAAPAVCLVTRQGRLGWSLSESLGPENAKLDMKQLQKITTALPMPTSRNIPLFALSNAFWSRTQQCLVRGDSDGKFWYRGYGRWKRLHGDKMQSM
jgi:hypothetical protein